MSEFMRKVQKGNEDTMQALFENEKRKTVWLCHALLCDAALADTVAAKSFKFAFEQAAEGNYENTSAFYSGVTKKAIHLCKIYAEKKNTKAFHVPQGKNFTQQVYDPSKMDFSGKEEEIVLKNLPPLYRFAYVLSVLCDYSPAKIGRLFHMHAVTVEIVLDSIQRQVEKIASLAKTRDVLCAASEEALTQWLLAFGSMDGVSGAVNTAVLLAIDTICAPIKQRQKEKWERLLTTASVVFVIIALAVSIIFVTRLTDGTDDTDGTNAVTDTADTEEDSVTFTSEYTATHYAYIEIENYGTVTVALDANKAPETVENFVSLASEGFYDGLTFHRIVEDFVMQGGDPDADGTGANTDEDGNEINITGEFAANGSDNNLSHTRGAISMARGEDYDSASSQFFIVHEETYISSLDGYYAVFGYVTDGMDIVDAICGAEYTFLDDNYLVAEDEQPTISSITVTEVIVESDTAATDTEATDTEATDTEVADTEETEQETTA